MPSRVMTAMLLSHDGWLLPGADGAANDCEEDLDEATEDIQEAKYAPPSWSVSHLLLYGALSGHTLSWMCAASSAGNPEANAPMDEACAGLKQQLGAARKIQRQSPANQQQHASSSTAAVSAWRCSVHQNCGRACLRELSGCSPSWKPPLPEDLHLNFSVRVMRFSGCVLVCSARSGT